MANDKQAYINMLTSFYNYRKKDESVRVLLKSGPCLTRDVVGIAIGLPFDFSNKTINEQQSIIENLLRYAHNMDVSYTIKEDVLL